MKWNEVEERDAARGIVVSHERFVVQPFLHSLQRKGHCFHNSFTFLFSDNLQLCRVNN